MELLAPVGSWDALVAAVENGAEAVYFGGKLFNARQFANNFGNEELKRAVDFAHVRGVRVFITVNILIADGEMVQALDFLQFLYTIGVDAIIVQDLGLLRAARHLWPDWEIHASTQMTVHNVAGTAFLQELGVNRVVLAREMSLAEIEEIKHAVPVELEVFVHGALCICYSGQCLMSSLIGGRSGNRGRCAQPCRLTYTLVDRQGRVLAEPEKVGPYLLSPRDLNMSEHLADLQRAGVTSLKIEGRMKRPEYVATVVRVYRQILDRLNKGEGDVTPRERLDLLQAFNRGFTTGYFYGRPGRELMSYRRPNNRGLRLGRVVAYHPHSRRAEIKLEEELGLGDGIMVWVSAGGRAGAVVHEIWQEGRRVERAPKGAVVSIAVTGKVQPGDRVFKTHDARLMQAARRSFTSAREEKAIPLHFSVEAAVGSPLVLTVRDNLGFTATVQTKVVGQHAINRPITEEYLRRQLDRLGNTPFALAGLDCRLAPDVMVPAGAINEARRQAVDRMQEMRAAAFYRPPAREKPWPVQRDAFMQQVRSHFAGRTADSPTCRGPWPVTKSDDFAVSVSVGDLASLQEAVAGGADIVYFGGESFHGKQPVRKEDVRYGLEFCHSKGCKLVLNSPRILKERELETFVDLVHQAHGWGVDGLLATGGGIYRAAAAVAPGLPVYADFTMHAFNRQTVVALAEQGFAGATLSLELTMNQIKELASLTWPLECVIDGALPLMVSEYCVIGSVLGGHESQHACRYSCREGHFALRDRTGAILPLETDQYCRMHIFNAHDLCLLEDLPTLWQTGVRVFRLEGKTRSPEYVGQVVRIYKKEFVRYHADPAAYRLDLEAMEWLVKLHSAGLTKGHYYRGVL